MARRLENKVAVITGAGRGIGRAIASVLAQEGAKVLVVDVDDHSAGECAEALRKSGLAADHLRADVSSVTDTRAMVSKALDAFGRID
ncbi:MAG: SDR family NAD(P)-dependent oxidoreductase, partial [Dongiaceae bacterium]